MSVSRHWRVSYLPTMGSGNEVEWVFYGTKDELDAYLNSKHSCSCSGCSGTDWWDSLQSAEYIVEELEDGWRIVDHIFVFDRMGNSYLIPLTEEVYFYEYLNDPDKTEKFEQFFNHYKVDNISNWTFRIGARLNSERD